MFFISASRVLYKWQKQLALKGPQLAVLRTAKYVFAQFASDYAGVNFVALDVRLAFQQYQMLYFGPHILVELILVLDRVLKRPKLADKPKKQA